MADKRTPLHAEHVKLGAKMVQFGGWDMPLSYSGIVAEHLATRKYGGVFDVSHMGRFLVGGKDAVPFLQYVLTTDVTLLPPGRAHYAIIPDRRGGAVDDAYLYRLDQQEYMLVVNASNAEKDLEWFRQFQSGFPGLSFEDRTSSVAMLAVQGPCSEEILAGIIGGRAGLPGPRKNSVAAVEALGRQVFVSRTGYTGEPLGFEVFVPDDIAAPLFRLLLERGKAAGVAPVGLGARDTLRLETGLPLYGNELGKDIEGKNIPIFAIAAARVGVSIGKGRMVGATALLKQHLELSRASAGGPVSQGVKRALPKVIVPFFVSGGGIARRGHPVFVDGRQAGYVTSGTAVPYWQFEGRGAGAKPGNVSRTRAIGLAYLDTGVGPGRKIAIQVRDDIVEGIVVKAHISNASPPYARPLLPRLN